MQSRLKLLAFAVLAVVATACNDKTVKVYEANTPIYQSAEEWRQTTFQLEAARSLRHPGKIYVYNNLLLVNEVMEGVHIFDNSNPSNPSNLGFLPILANVDMAVRHNILYVDSYTDLLAFNLADPSNPQYMGRVADVFNFDQHWLIAGFDPAYPMATVDATKGIVTGWEIDKVTEEGDAYYPPFMEDMLTSNFASNTTGTTFLGGVGKAGSMARFAIAGDYLYTLEANELGVFSVEGDMHHVRDLTLNRVSETLFPYGDNLFVGTTTGMLIYNISDPSMPSFVSDYTHITSCDPVVVEGDKAFVTLSTGRTCFGNTNALHVVDLANLSFPTLVRDYSMTNPKGLGVDGSLLFLCDGPDGLKVYDKGDLHNIDQHRIAHFPNITTTDVIPLNGTLIMTSAQGIYQYSYADPGNIVQLSLIPVQN